MPPNFNTSGVAPPPERQARICEVGGGRHWQVPEESPIAFVYNRRNYAVMLATPKDMEDFAVGFSLTERVVDCLDEIAQADIHQSDRGIEIHLSIAPEKLERLDLRQQRRNLVGRAGCGVCGLENAEVFFETLPRVEDSQSPLSQAALSRALGSALWLRFQAQRPSPFERPLKPISSFTAAKGMASFASPPDQRPYYK